MISEEAGEANSIAGLPDLTSQAPGDADVTTPIGAAITDQGEGKESDSEDSASTASTVPYVEPEGVEPTMKEDEPTKSASSGGNEFDQDLTAGTPSTAPPNMTLDRSITTGPGESKELSRVKVCRLSH